MDKTVGAQVLSTDSEAKLQRVFCFLRQHDRKARLERKMAELNTWWPSSPPAKPEGYITSAEQPSPTEALNTTNLVTEPNLLATSEELDGEMLDKREITSSGNTTVVASKVSASTIHNLRNEIKELQKGILVSSSDTSGFITAIDLVSCMRNLNRVPSLGEVQWMIWEVDNDLDGSISWEEFKDCYVRTLLDLQGLELNQLYYLTQFLLCDTDNSQTVSADEIAAELQRIGNTEHLTAKLWSIFKEESEEHQLLRKMTLSEFLDAMQGDLPTSFNLH